MRPRDWLFAAALIVPFIAAVGNESGRAANGTGIRVQWVFPAHESRHAHNPAILAGFTDIACPAPRVCYAAGYIKGGPNGFGGSTMLSTVNGGTVWHLQNDPLIRNWNAVPNHIICPAVRVCYAIGSAASILHTADGGRSWRSQRNPLSGTYRVIYGIACPSVTTCYAVGDHTRILATTNGGGSWHDQRSSLRPNAYPSDIACASVTRCYIAGGGADMSGHTHSTMAVTTNGGRSWRRQRVPTVNALWSIACPSLAVCYAVGAAGTILYTANSGHTWSRQHSPLTPLDHLSDIACPSATTCFALGGVRYDIDRTRYVILATENGGAAWSLQQASLGGSTYYTIPFGIDCPTVNTCYVVGGTRLVTTTDGGQIWRRLPVRTR